MRNRGLEIYILEQGTGEEEDRSVGKCDDYDLKSIICNEGLNDNHLIESLLRINKFINALTLGEKTPVNQLLQASFLISQQITRGISAKEAFVRTVMEIYYKTRSKSEFNVQNVKEVIVDEIERIFLNDLRIPFVSDVTLKTNELQMNSSLARIRQQAVLPIKYQSDGLLRYFLIHYYTIACSVKDVTLRSLFIKKKMTMIDDNKSLMDGLEKITREYLILRTSTKQLNVLPIDTRWLSRESSTIHANNLILTLYYQLVKYFDELDDDKRGRKGVKEFTLLRYAYAIKCKLIDSKIDDVGIKSIGNLLELYDVNLLNNIKTIPIDDVTLINVISLLNWRFVIYKFMRDNNIQLKSKTFTQTLTNFHLHYKWFLKRSIKNINELLNCFDKNVEIETIVNEVSSHLTGHFSASRKLAKKFRRTLRLPPPLINDVQVKDAEIVADLFAKNTLHDKTCNFTETISRFLRCDNLRDDIIKLKIQMDYEYNVKLNYGPIEELSSKTIKKAERLDVNILPLYDYIGVLQLLSSRHLPEYFKKVPTIPTILIALIERYNNTLDERLLNELTSAIYDYKLNAPAIKNKCYVRFDLDKFDDDRENDCDQDLSLHNPIVTYLTTGLLLDDVRDSLKATSFGSYRMSTDFHRKVKEILWHNVQQLSDVRYDFVRNELNYLSRELADFAIKLSATLQINSCNGDYTITLKSCLEKLNETLDKKDKTSVLLVEILRELLLESPKLETINKNNCHLAKLHLIANLYILINLFKSLLNSNLPPVDRLIKLTFKKKYANIERENFRNLLSTYELQNDVYSNSRNNLHPLCENIKEKIVKIDEEIVNFDKYVAVRPENLTYATVINVSDTLP